MARSPARDRRGRGMRSELFRAPVPAVRSRAQHFSQLASRILERIAARADGELDEVVLAVDLAPRSAPPGGRAPELGRVFPAAPSSPATILLHRLPIISRCADSAELFDMLNEVLCEQASVLCGREPEDLRPQW